MHISTRSARRAAAATSALALAAGGAFLASPATAATSGDIGYSCDVLGNPQPFTGTHTVADTAPYGGNVVVSGTIVVPDSLRGFLYGSNTRSVDGTTKVYALAAGMVPITVDETVPKQDLPASGDWTINANGVLSLAPYVGATPAGTELPVSLQDRPDAADLEATLQNYDGTGAKQGNPIPIPCEISPDLTAEQLTVGTVTIVPAKSGTVAKLTYNAKKKVTTGKATVTSSDSNVTPDGNVKLTLKKGKKTIDSVTKPLNDAGVASMKWKGALKSGTYKLVAKYVNSNFETSSDSATKKVS